MNEFWLFYRCTSGLKRPEAGREVGPQANGWNKTRDHKSVWDGPPSKATGHERVAVAFLKIGNFAPIFDGTLHMKGQNFPDVFIRSRLHNYDSYEPWKVSWKSVRTFFENPEDRHTDRRGNFIYAAGGRDIFDEGYYTCNSFTTVISEDTF